MIDVIIPVGPGHETIVNRAIDSVSIASEFAKVQTRVIQVDDTEGLTGRSSARNHGVEKADADWLFFLDADDLMHPEALNHYQSPLGDYDAIFGLTTELDTRGNVLTRYQVPRIESYDELLRCDPFLSIKMAHFVKREVAEQLPFNTDMDCGEDWDYYLRLWAGFRCVKINLPLFIKTAGNHSTGPRSATGKEWNTAVDKLIKDARGSL